MGLHVAILLAALTHGQWLGGLGGVDSIALPDLSAIEAPTGLPLRASSVVLFQFDELLATDCLVDQSDHYDGVMCPASATPAHVVGKVNGARHENWSSPPPLNDARTDFTDPLGTTSSATDLFLGSVIKNYTVESLIRMGSYPSGYWSLLNNSVFGGVFKWYLYIDATGHPVVHYTTAPGTGGTCTGDTAVSLNTWTLVGATAAYQSGPGYNAITIYYNGIAHNICTVDVGVYGSASYRLASGNDFGYGYPINSDIDSTGVYAEVLSPAQMLSDAHRCGVAP